MSLSLVHEFKTHIYQLLCGHKLIIDNINNIYISVQQDARYPFILINFLNLKDCSKFDVAIYNINFEIAIFIRNKNPSSSLSLVDEINKIFELKKYRFGKYSVLGIEMSDLNFSQCQDLITTKTSIIFNSTIKGL